MKANRKWLKADLASGVRKLSPDFIVPKLDEFPLFDEFFPDLDDFWDLDVFWPFNFFDFLVISTPLPSTLLPSSPSPTFSKVDFSGGAAVFSIEVSRTAILLKSWMNHQ